MTDEQRNAFEAALKDLQHQAAFGSYDGTRRVATAALRALEALSGIRAPLEKDSPQPSKAA